MDYLETKASDGVFWAIALRCLMLAIASLFWPCAGGDQAGPGRYLLRGQGGWVFSKALVSAPLCMHRSWPPSLCEKTSEWPLATFLIRPPTIEWALVVPSDDLSICIPRNWPPSLCEISQSGPRSLFVPPADDRLGSRRAVWRTFSLHVYACLAAGRRACAR